MSLHRRSVWQAGVFMALSVSATAGTTTRVSVRTSGSQGSKASFNATISADGRYVAFGSDAKDLVSGDTNGNTDVFVRDLSAGTTTRISVAPNGTQGNGDSGNPRISPDGRFVAFVSDASNLVPGDTNGSNDIFVRDLSAGTTTRVSVDSGGVQGNGHSYAPCMSSDGRFVAFHSDASNLVLGDTNGALDVFVHDSTSGATFRASVDSAGVEGNGFSVNPSISGDGRYIAFESLASNLVPGDTNKSVDVFVYDAVSSTIQCASISSLGTLGDGNSLEASISAEGRWVAFASAATNLIHGDSNAHDDIFVRDLAGGVTTRVSIGAAGVEADGNSTWPVISIDGRFVAFESHATNLVAADTNGTKDVFLHDRWVDATTRLSVDSSDVEGNGASLGVWITADGRKAVFESAATNLVAGDTNGCDDVFLRDRGDGSEFVSYCFGDGTGPACPCANSGAPGHGCENSSTTGGAVLTVVGAASLALDTVQFTSSGEKPTALSIVLQGTTSVAAVHFGDGLRCASGLLKRLYVANAVGGVVTAPQGSDLSVSARSAALGDVISLGATRVYHAYYRDADATFCASPAGSTYNVSNAIAVAWGP
ncbi:MAG TPA: hypothetical protein VGR31_04940 [Planctomycetota bacterium]|jgi:Tol biopolymer transport system component|nr:hypothetical protein [Planctomycetota bacterium]